MKDPTDNYMKVNEMSQRETSELIYEHQLMSAQLSDFVESADTIFEQVVHIILTYGHGNAERLRDYIDEAETHYQKQHEDMNRERPSVVKQITRQCEIKLNEEKKDS